MSKKENNKTSQIVYRDFVTEFEPRCFDDVVGQKEEVGMIKKWILEKTIPKGILFLGGSGVGKTMLANLLRRSAACENRADNEYEACEKCGSCRVDARWSSYNEYGSRINPEAFREVVIRGRCSGVGGYLGSDKHGQWYPILVNELHKLKKEAQLDLNHELELPWSKAFIVATSSYPKGIEEDLQERFDITTILPPKKSEIQDWMVGICCKTGITIADPQATAVVVDITKGHFRRMLKLLQKIRDYSLTLDADNVRKVAEKMGLDKIK